MFILRCVLALGWLANLGAAASQNRRKQEQVTKLRPFASFAQRLLQPNPRTAVPTSTPTSIPTSTPTSTPSSFRGLTPAPSSFVLGPGCANAYELVFTDEFLETGSTRDFPREPFPGVCPVIQPGAATRHYRLPGDGLCYEVSTRGSDFDTVLAVYRGTSCDADLQCEAQNDDTSFSGGGDAYYGDDNYGDDGGVEDDQVGGDNGLQSQVLFYAAPGEDYWIVLGGYGDDTGAYEFSVQETACGPAPTNIDCASALTVVPPLAVEASLLFVPLGYVTLTGECAYDGLLEALWYRVEGDGTCMEVRMTGGRAALFLLESPFADENPEACSPLEGCPLAATYNPQSGESLLQWKSVPGTSYFIILTDEEDASASSVTLDFDSFACDANSGTCGDAQALVEFPISIDGSLAFVAPTVEELFVECPNVSYLDLRSQWFELPVRTEDYCMLVNLQSNDPLTRRALQERKLEDSSGSLIAIVLEADQGFGDASCSGNTSLPCLQETTIFPDILLVPGNASNYLVVASYYFGGSFFLDLSVRIMVGLKRFRCLD
jgi:hypothetical protein